MPETLIIGYGNPLRGDDGLGWIAAESLREKAPPGAEVLSLHQLTIEVAEDLSRAARAIFIDAREGGTPGEWRSEPVAPDANNAQPFTHHVTPASLLAITHLLYGRAPEAVLYSMSGESFDYRESLSAPVAAALPGMLEAISRRA